MKRFLFVSSFFLIVLNGILAQEAPRAGVRVSDVQVVDRLLEVEISFDLPDGFHQIRQENFFFIAPAEASPYSLHELIYPDGEDYYGTVTLLGRFSTEEGEPPPLEITAAYQLCDEEGVCYFPQETTLTVFENPEQNENFSSAGAESISLLTLLLLAAAGGLLLNLMPCVLPVLSLRALGMVKTAGENRAAQKRESLLYGAGVVGTFALFGLILAFIRASGDLAGWGFQFQNPLFTMGLSTVVFLFALSLFELFPIQGPSFQLGDKRSDALGAIAKGVMAVLLATPCSAPFMGTALGLALSQSPVIILLTLTVMGLAFSLPFVLIGFIPGLSRLLPKPGSWMKTFQAFMGFILLGTVFYLMTFLQYQLSMDQLMGFLLYLLLAAAGAWFYGLVAGSRKLKQPLKHLAALLFLTALILPFPLYFGGSRESTDSNPTGLTSSALEGWYTFSPETLKQARDEGRGVFIAFGAKWCSSCKLNEKQVLSTERTLTLFERENILPLYGDYTNGDPLIEEWLVRFERGGVPVYVYYPPGNKSFRFAPEILTYSKLEATIRDNVTETQTLGDDLFFD